jgi:hypothetical protein
MRQASLRAVAVVALGAPGGLAYAGRRCPNRSRYGRRLSGGGRQLARRMRPHLSPPAPQKRKGLKSILVFFRANTFALYAALGPTSFAVPTLIQPELPSFQGGKRERFA